MLTTTPLIVPGTVTKPSAATGGKTPPVRGSIEEMAETALALGWPGAFGETCHRVEQLIRCHLLWES